MAPLMLFGVPHTRTPCPSCLAVSKYIRTETCLPLPEGAMAPLSRSKFFKYICFDCAAAETVMAGNRGITFSMARITTGNDRQEKLRLPGVLMGIPFVHPSHKDDLKWLQAWQMNTLKPFTFCDSKE